jgi:hypothetical protein
MGWRRCDGCGRTISDRAPNCPFCAAPNALATPGAFAAATAPAAASAPAIAPGFPVPTEVGATPQPVVGGDSRFHEAATPDGLAGPTRLAGWLLILGGVAGAVAPVASFARGGAVVDVVIGAALALNSPKWRVWALVRVVLGTIVWPIVALVQHDNISLVVQLFYSASLLVLLQERPRRALVPWAIGVATIVLVLTYFGLAVMLAMPQQAAPQHRGAGPRRGF